MKEHSNDKEKKEKPFDFIVNTLKILQNKNPIPEGFSKNEKYKYPFEILNDLSKKEKENTINLIRNEYNKYFSEEFEIAKQFWKSMNFISIFLSDESKKNLLKDEEIMDLLDNYKSEEEMAKIENEIKNKMNSDDEDQSFWQNACELLNFLKHKKLMEDLYNNFINNQRIKNRKLEIIEEKDEEEDNDDQEDINIKKKNENKINDFNNYIDEVDNIDDDDIDEIENKKREKKVGKKEMSFKERYNIINEDLEKIRYNRFFNEDSDDNEDNMDDDEKTEEDLSPQKYDSDEELRKEAINQMDYFANLNSNRKKILLNKLNEYKENKRNEEINHKNKKKNKKVNKDIVKKEKNSNMINLNEEKEPENNNNNNNKNKVFLDFIMNQKAENLKKKEKDDDEKEKEDKESDEEALNFLQKISGHKKNKNNLMDIYNEELPGIDKKDSKEDKEENIELSEFQKTIQNFDKYLDKNDISGVYTNYEIIENTFRDLEKNTDNELVFNDIVEVKKEYNWSKEYKPIKPRFSNKKIIGFDWNRYNQAHYDNDNLPPKAVTGYRFNIFYPNLVDKTQTPRFYLQRSETPDMCIIRFESGAPYEDVAFKIINREWNTRVKGDYINQFDKGVLKLYFKFKRFRYKR